MFPNLLLRLLGLALDLARLVLFAHWFDHAFVDLSVLVCSGIVDAVDVSLIEQNDKDDIVTETSETVVSFRTFWYTSRRLTGAAKAS